MQLFKRLSRFAIIGITFLLSCSCLTNYLPEQDKEYLKVAKSIIVATDGNYVVAGTVDRDPTGYDCRLRTTEDRRRTTDAN
jgi:hypothetical protein